MSSFRALLYCSHLSQHVEEKPVSHFALLDDGVDDFALDQPEADVEEIGAHPRTEDDHGAVEHDQGRKGTQNQEPERLGNFFNDF